MRIVIIHPGRVELGVFPPPGYDRFDLLSTRRDHREEHPSAITVRLITKRFRKPVIAHGQAGTCPRQYGEGPRFLFRHRWEHIMKESVWHVAPLSALRDHLT